MPQRILIQVTEPDPQAATLPAEARRLLEDAGADEVRASHSELAGLFTAVVPDHANVDELIKRLAQSPGVRHVERDTMRGAF